MECGGVERYVCGMAKPQAVTSTEVRDPASGRIVAVHGAGALAGKLTLQKGIDLTKPVAAQTAKRFRKAAKGSVKD
jgi:hypothetical protein